MVNRNTKRRRQRKRDKDVAEERRTKRANQPPDGWSKGGRAEQMDGAEVGVGNRWMGQKREYRTNGWSNGGREEQMDGAKAGERSRWIEQKRENGADG